MKTKVVGVLMSAVALLVPVVSSALVVSINGQSGTAQTLATTTATSTMHMKIVSASNTHTFQWDNTPWRVDQGGTGATSFTNGSIPFIYNDIFSQNNAQLFWDNVSNVFSVGGTTTLTAKVNIRGSGSLGLLNIASTTGASLLYINSSGSVGIGTTSPSEKLEVSGNVRLSGTLFSSLLNVVGASTLFGSVGIGNSNPQHALDVSGAMYSRLVTASAPTINWNSGNVQTFTLTSNPTLTFSNGQAGGEYKLILKQDSTGGRTVTWPADVQWSNGMAPTLTATANHKDVISFVKDGDGFYLGSFNLDYASTTSSSGNATGTVAVLVVAGGGAGGDGGSLGVGGGGGGGGGYQASSTFPVTAQAYSVTVGAGGVAAAGDGTTSGSNSTFSTITAIGGGRGGLQSVGADGGSGGGGSTIQANAEAGGTGSQGFNGGASSVYNSAINGGGGGGGSSAVGADGTTSAAGNGGAGIGNSISGVSVTYAGGGGGGASRNMGVPGTGGAGGGGNGAVDANAVSGTPNTGGGGGGDNAGGLPGSGGSGIVIISYPTGSITATGGTITTSGGNTIHTFTSSGTFTVTAIN